MVDLDELTAIGRALLTAIGEDPDRDGLADTPRRFAQWWAEFVEHDPGRVDTAFKVDGADEMIVVRGIHVWSLCEHHLLPFSASVTIGYIPAGVVLGLSKLARIAHLHAHRLQVQERLVAQIADSLTDVTGSPDVAVVAYGEHLCMSMRGVRSEASMRTSVTRGAFRDKPAARGEFFALADGH